MANFKVFKMGFMYTLPQRLGIFEELDRPIELTADLGELPDFGPRNPNDSYTLRVYEVPHTISIRDALLMYHAIDKHVTEVLKGNFDGVKGEAIDLREGARRLAIHANDMLFAGQRRVRVVRKGNDADSYAEAAKVAVRMALRYNIPVLDMLTMPPSVFDGFSEMPEFVSIGVDMDIMAREDWPRLPIHFVYIESSWTKGIQYSHTVDMNKD